MKHQAILQHIASDRALDRNTVESFLLQIQQAVLMELKETGRLDEKQYQSAAGKLRYRFTHSQNETDCAIMQEEGGTYYD